MRPSAAAIQFLLTLPPGIQQCDYATLGTAIRTSWHLTSIPGPIRPLSPPFAFRRDYLAAARIRQALTTNPPNPRARFVTFDLSDTGLQVTRS